MRVKVYKLNSNNDWLDQGTGYLSLSECLGELVLTVIDEVDTTKLLNTNISITIHYTLQNDSLIVWTSIDGIDWALSFQLQTECQLVYSTIHTFTQHTITLPTHLNSIHDIDTLLLTLQNSDRDRLVTTIIDNDYFYTLTITFTENEKLNNTAMLHKLYDVIIMLTCIYDVTLFNYILSDDYYSTVFGILEYDSYTLQHRLLLNNPSRFKQIITLDSSTISAIKLTDRLCYLKDVALARVLDDGIYQLLTRMIYVNNMEIVENVIESDTFTLLFSATSTVDRHTLLLFVFELCEMSRNFNLQLKCRVYSKLLDNQLLSLLGSLDAVCIDIVNYIVDFDIKIIRNYILESITSNSGNGCFLGRIIKCILVDTTCITVKQRLNQILKLLLDTLNHLVPIANASAVLDKDVAGSAVKSSAADNVNNSNDVILLDYFYKNYALLLLEPCQPSTADSNSAKRKLTLSQCLFYELLLDFYVFMLKSHSFRSKYVFLQSSSILFPFVNSLYSSKYKSLQLMCIKFYRMCLLDSVLVQVLLERGVFKVVLGSVSKSGGLVQSVVLELFHYVVEERVVEVIVGLRREWELLERVKELADGGSGNWVFGKVYEMCLRVGDGNGWVCKSIDAVEERYFMDTSNDVSGDGDAKNEHENDNDDFKPLKLKAKGEEEEEGVGISLPVKRARTPIIVKMEPKLKKNRLNGVESSGSDRSVDV